MSAEIITFPAAKRSVREGLPVRGESGEERLIKALHWDEMGLGLEDIPADASPDFRRLIELLLDVPSHGPERA